MTNSPKPSPTLRDRLLTVLDEAAPDLSARMETDPAAHLDLVALARDAQGETAALLQAAVDSARSAGCTWEQIGQVLGMTRQAAQQRYGRIPSSEPVAEGPTVMTLAPLTAFNEMRVLHKAGQFGWRGVRGGFANWVVERDSQQWEHARTAFGAHPWGEGWEPCGPNWGFWTYWCRPTGLAPVPGNPSAVDLLH